MIGRVLAFSSAVLGGAGASQYPEYAQQYAQRLSGAVEELTRVTEDFDASAAASGLTRQQALDELSGTEFLDNRKEDMSRAFARHARLTVDLEALETAGPYARALQAWRLTDSDVARAAWEDFEPAVPVTAEGAVFAGGGLVLGWLSWAVIWGAIVGLFRRLFRGRRQAAVAGHETSAADTPPLDASRVDLRWQALSKERDRRNPRS